VAIQGVCELTNKVDFGEGYAALSCGCAFVSCWLLPLWGGMHITTVCATNAGGHPEKTHLAYIQMAFSDVGYRRETGSLTPKSKAERG
jgi:hypothetical protein